MSERKPLIAGNWKLNKTVGEAVELAGAIAQGSVSAPCELVVAPVFTALHPVSQALAGKNVGLSAQDVYWEDSGAFTGEVSAPLLKDAGCTYCIVGHSERRALFGETNKAVRRKLDALLHTGLKPILCVGETLEQREAGSSVDVVLGQLEGGLEGLPSDQLAPLVIAYEPVWAIGTGRTAQPKDAQEVHAAIRGWFAQHHPALAPQLRILYGGSVKPDNAKELLGQPDVDGALVGGASLKPDDFLAIAAAAAG